MGIKKHLGQMEGENMASKLSEIILNNPEKVEGDREKLDKYWERAMDVFRESTSIPKDIYVQFVTNMVLVKPEKKAEFVVDEKLKKWLVKEIKRFQKNGELLKYAKYIFCLKVLFLEEFKKLDIEQDNDLWGDINWFGEGLQRDGSLDLHNFSVFMAKIGYDRYKKLVKNNTRDNLLSLLEDYKNKKEWSNYSVVLCDIRQVYPDLFEGLKDKDELREILEKEALRVAGQDWLVKYNNEDNGEFLLDLSDDVLIYAVLMAEKISVTKNGFEVTMVGNDDFDEEIPERPKRLSS